MSERFFVDAAITSDRAVLRGGEAHHLLHVMRFKVGDGATLFDGSGAEFTAQIEQLGRSHVDMRVLARNEVNRELPIELTLAVALPKGDHQRWLVEKAVELGVTRIVPLRSNRSVAEASAAALNRLRRTVIEASKQCGRNRLMEISAPQTLERLISEDLGGGLRIVAHPGGTPLAQLRNTAAPGARWMRVVAAIGPEGGFAAEEIQAARAANWQLVDLGPRILRTETAAVAIAAFVSQELAMH